MKVSREVRIGDVIIGGGREIAVQSMTNTETKDVASTVNQIRRLEKAGCEIVRCAVYDTECADVIPLIKKEISIPLVADIHFDYRVAVAAIKNGADKVRINPGNIGGRDKILEVVKAAKDHGVPIRVGGNTGSLPEDIAASDMRASDALVVSAERNIAVLEEAGFSDIVVSLKSSDVRTTVEAYRKMAEKYDYPLHLGITEAGIYEDAAVKSAIGLGTLLLDGIGDTIRVSVSGDPVSEIAIAKKILAFTGLGKGGVEIVSCPTCSRCSLDIENIVKRLKEYTADFKGCFKIAVMGCVVNGPGEAKGADFGIAGGKGKAMLFVKGEEPRFVGEDDIVSELKVLCDRYERSGR